MRPCRYVACAQKRERCVTAAYAASARVRIALRLPRRGRGGSAISPCVSSGADGRDGLHVVERGVVMLASRCRPRRAVARRAARTWRRLSHAPGCARSLRKYARAGSYAPAVAYASPSRKIAARPASSFCERDELRALDQIRACARRPRRCARCARDPRPPRRALARRRGSWLERRCRACARRATARTSRIASPRDPGSVELVDEVVVDVGFVPVVPAGCCSALCARDGRDERDRRAASDHATHHFPTGPASAFTRTRRSYAAALVAREVLAHVGVVADLHAHGELADRAGPRR